MIRPILLAGAVVALPSLAVAQGLEFDGSVTLGANFNSIGGIPGTDINLNGYSFDFDGDLHFDESFSVGIGAGFNTGNLEVTGAPNDINVDLISLSVEPVYQFSSGAYVGGYYRMGDLDLALAGPVTIGIDTSQYGIFGGYDFGQGHVEAFYGMSELGENSLIPVALNTDVTDFGASGSYEVMTGLEVFGSVMRTNIESGAINVPLTAYAVGAEYDLGNGFDIYGAIGGSALDLSDLAPIDDITAFGATIGASYDLSSTGSLPLVLSAEYSRTNVDLGTLAPIIGGNDLTVDRFALGVTVPIGNGSTTPLNSNTRTARGEYRSAVSALINSF